MADRPILFTGEMVRALIAGRKTQTRRLTGIEDDSRILDFVKVATDTKTGRAVFEMKDKNGDHVHVRKGKHATTPQFMPPIAIGDRLWVRETWAVKRFEPCLDHERDWQSLASPIVRYAADNAEIQHHSDRSTGVGVYHGPVEVTRPSIFLPRWASRLTLTVTDVRIVRLQAISEEDAIAEGVEPLHAGYFPYGITTFMTTFVGEREVPAQYCACARDSYARLWNFINGRGTWEANPWVIAYTFRVAPANIDRASSAAAKLQEAGNGR